MAFDYTNFLENDAAVEADFIITDRAGNFDVPLAATNTQGQWCLGVGTTVSNGTGPAANYSGRTGFVYTESSGPVASSVWALQRDEVFDNTTQNVFLDIVHNLFVDTGSQYYVEYATNASPNQTTDWTILATISGTNTEGWIPVTYDFSSVPLTTTLRIRIRFESLSDFTNDLAFSTWREYSVDTQVDGAGLVLSSANKNLEVAGTENPSAFVSEKDLPWATATLLLRRKSFPAGGTHSLEKDANFSSVTTTGNVTVRNGATIDGLTINADVFLDEAIDLSDVTINGNLNLSVADTYTFSNVTVNGKVINNDSSGNVNIDSLNGSVLSADEPGTGNGQVNINNNVIVNISALDVSDSNPILGARIYVVAAAGGDITEGTILSNAETDVSGNVSFSVNLTANQPIRGRVRKASTDPRYKTSSFSGVITNSGFETTVFMIKD